jgi:hypothetical protein
MFAAFIQVLERQCHLERDQDRVQERHRNGIVFMNAFLLVRNAIKTAEETSPQFAGLVINVVLFWSGCG